MYHDKLLIRKYLTEGMRQEGKGEYEEFTEAESQLQMEYQKVQVEYEGMLLQLDSLNKDYEVKRLMALDKGESIKQQMIQMERAIQVYQAEKVGPQGELMKKSAQMEYEILLSNYHNIKPN